MYNRKLASVIAVLLVIVSLVWGFLGRPASRDARNLFAADRANVLSDATEAMLSRMAASRSDGVALSVVTVRMPRALAYTSKHYAEEVWKAWKLGEGDMLLLLDVSRGEYFFKYDSDSLGGVLDNVYSSLLQNDLKPSFAAKEYDRAVNAFCEALYGRIESARPTVSPLPGGEETESSWSFLNFSPWDFIKGITGKSKWILIIIGLILLSLIIPRSHGGH